MNRNCNTCKKIDENKYLKDRTVCKTCYSMNRRKNKFQQPKLKNTIHKKPIIKNNFQNKTCHRQFIIGNLGYGISYLLNYNLLKIKDQSL